MSFVANQVRVLVAEAVEQHEPAEAAEIIERAILQSDEMFRYLMTPRLSSAVWELIKKRRRETVSKKPATFKQREKEKESRAALGRAAARNWLAFKMHNGSALGDANRSQLQSAVEHHRDQSRVENNYASFYAMISQSVGNETVKDVFTSERLEGIAGRLGL